MSVELGGISRLYGGNACLISSRTVQINGILQYISAFPHLIDEELGTFVLDLYEIHIPVGLHRQAYNQLVTGFQPG